MLNFIVQRLHREGYRYVAISGAITFILLLIVRLDDRIKSHEDNNAKIN